MKRALCYITIFLLICTLLMNISEKVNSSIITYYMPDLIKDIGDMINNKDIVYIDGNMLSIYLHISNENYMLDGNAYNQFSGGDHYEYMKDNTYKVERNGDLYENYLIVTSSKSTSEDITKINTMFKINKIILYKTIVFNVIALIGGVILFFMHERKGNKRGLMVKFN